MITLLLSDEWIYLLVYCLNFGNFTIQPAKSAQNAYIERFNRSYREAVLDMYLFRSSEEVQSITNKWINHYNEERPHEALNSQTPLNFTKQLNPNFSICVTG